MQVKIGKIGELKLVVKTISVKRLAIGRTLKIAVTRLFFSRLFQNSRENSRDFRKTNTL